MNPDVPKAYHDNQRTVSSGQSDGMKVAPKPPSVEIHSLRPTDQYPVNHEKCAPMDNKIKFPAQLWEKNRKDAENDVQKSFTVNADAAGKLAPFISFAAQEKFRKNKRAIERKSECAGHLARNNTRKEATFCQSRNNTNVERDWPCEPAAIWNGSFPLPPVKKLIASRKVKLIPIPDAFFAKHHAKYPPYARLSIPAGTYNGIDNDTPSFSLANGMVISKDVPEDLVYKMTKAIFENLDNLKAVHPAFGRVTKSTILNGFGAPLHPGALKYYREIGVPGIEEFVKRTAN